MTRSRSDSQPRLLAFVAASSARHSIGPNRDRRTSGLTIFSLSTLLCALCVCALALAFPSAAAEERASASTVLELRLDGEVEPILATYINEGIADAAHRNAALVLITMDTPGGLTDSMKD